MLHLGFSGLVECSKCLRECAVCVRILRNFFDSVTVGGCREKWYGLLFSQTASSRKANLVLCVLYPGSELPWLGQLEYLGPKVVIDDPRVVKPGTADTLGFPVGTLHLPSFHSPSSLLWVKEPVLQVGRWGGGAVKMWVGCAPGR